MQIKRYEALSVNEAVRKIKADLGPDAIVLSTRSLKGKVEVFAARDDPGLGIKTGLGIEKGGMMESDMFALFKTEIDQLKTLIMDSREEKDIRAELTELKETLNDLFDALGVQKNRGISPHLSKVYCHLISGGISKPRTFQLMEELKNACSTEELKSYHNTLKVVENIIKQSISACYKGMEKKERYHNSLKRIVAFVGPAGSGRAGTGLPDGLPRPQPHRHAGRHLRCLGAGYPKHALPLRRSPDIRRRPEEQEGLRYRLDPTHRSGEEDAR